MTTSIITWKPVAEGLPDSDMTVLAYCPESSEPVWLRFYDGEAWRDSDGFYAPSVTHWAELPECPIVPPVARDIINAPEAA